MTILSFETSCDETGISLIEAEGGLGSLEFEIIDEIVASQVETHKDWGGVVPHLAAREHKKNLPVLFEKMSEDNDMSDVERVAVTVGPGLDPCLWRGINYVKEIKDQFLDTEIAGANHLEGHLYSFFLSSEVGESRYSIDDIDSLFPAVQLIVSGGHTMVVLMKSLTEWEILGRTRDDAAGEAFDKVARMLALPYPGGPEIEKASEGGDPDSIDFPRPMIDSGDYDFSFAGLKTAILYYLKDNAERKSEDELKFNMSDEKRANVAASFQQSVVDVLVSKTFSAAREYSAQSVMISGGVAANGVLREKMKRKSERWGVKLLKTPIRYNTDNATIIAIASYINNLTDKSYELEAQPNLSL